MTPPRAGRSDRITVYAHHQSDGGNRRIGVVKEQLGRRVGIATPNIDLLYAMTRLMAESRGLL